MKNVSKIAKRVRLIQGTWITGVLLVLAIVVFISFPLVAQAVISCGSTITKDTVLNKNIGPCSSGNGIIIGASGITLNCKGHFISGNADDPSSSGILLNGVNNVTVKNCNVTAFFSGIAIEGGSFNILTKNTANLNGILTHDEGFGFRLESSSFNTLVGNTADNNGHAGFSMTNCFNNVLTNNSAVRDHTGFDLINNSTFNVLNGNAASENSFAGFDLKDSSSNNTLTGNTSTNNSNWGFLLEPSADSEVLTGNTASNNAAEGFRLDTSSTNSVNKNLAINNLAGFALSGSDLNFFIQNSTFNNFLFGFGLDASSTNTFIKNKTSETTGFEQDSSSINNVCIKNSFSCN